MPIESPRVQDLAPELYAKLTRYERWSVNLWFSRVLKDVDRKVVQEREPVLVSVRKGFLYGIVNGITLSMLFLIAGSACTQAGVYGDHATLIVFGGIMLAIEFAWIMFVLFRLIQIYRYFNARDMPSS